MIKQKMKIGIIVFLEKFLQISKRVEFDTSPV